METQTTYYKVRKFVYLSACALLGIVLFLLLEQILIQGFTILMNAGVIGLELTPASFNLADSLGTVLALGFGAWYGVWLGSYWHSIVYEGIRGKGFFYHLGDKLSEEPESSSAQASKTAPGLSVLGAKPWQVDDLIKVQIKESEPQFSQRPEAAKAAKPLPSQPFKAAAQAQPVAAKESQNPVLNQAAAKAPAKIKAPVVKKSSPAKAKIAAPVSKTTIAAKRKPSAK